MPIVSRRVEWVRPQRDGRCKVMEAYTGGRGESYIHGTYFVEVTDQQAVQDFLDTQAPIHEANARFLAAQKVKDSAGMAQAKADAEAATKDPAAIAAHVALIAACEAQLQPTVDARDWTSDLKGTDERLGLDAIDRTGDPDAFTPADLTRDEWNARVLNRFFGASIDIDRKFLCQVAGWVAGFAARDIAGLVGVTQSEAQAQIDRAIDLRDNVCPAMQASDDERDPTREVRSR